MAKIARKTNKIFALSATNTGQFGSAQAGTFVTSTDPATIQSLAAWSNGWLSATVSSQNLPALEEFQAVEYVASYQLSYLFQEGIPEYDSATTYYTNSLVKKSGTAQVYLSLVDNNTGNALVTGANWIFVHDFAANAKTLFPYSADTGTTNTFAISPTPAPSSYSVGQIYLLLAAHNNTGACTVNVSTLGAKSIKLLDGTDPASGQITTTGISVMIYNGTNMILINPVLGSAAYATAGTAAGNVLVLDGSGLVPLANIPSGITANKIVALNGSSQLPAVDGSLLTNLPSPSVGLTVGGRLTGLTGDADPASIANGTTIYFTPYKGDKVPLYNGTSWTMTTFTETSQLLTDTTKSPAAMGTFDVCDMFVWNDGGTIRCTRGPVWTGLTTRAAGGGLTLTNGLFLNTTAITNGPAALRGTWVGTVCNFNGLQQTRKSFGTAGALWSFWNAYNQLPFTIIAGDTTASWTYATAAWRETNGGSGTRVNIICGYKSTYNIEYTSRIQPAKSTTVNSGQIGVSFDNSNPQVSGGIRNSSSITTDGFDSQVTVRDTYQTAFGRYYIYGFEYGQATVSPTFYGVDPVTSAQATYITVEGFY
jgi:hypothetical protein